MITKPCKHCGECEIDIRRLRARNKKLEKCVKLATKIIKKQRAQLDDVQSYTWSVICKARKIMNGNLPRGTWSLWKGRLEVAGEVYGMVWIHWETLFLELVAKIQGL